MPIDLIIDFDSADSKRKLYNVLSAQKGRNVVQIKRYRQSRSLPQNAYLWGVVYRYLADETGHTTQEIHELMKRRFWSYENKGQTFAKSTKDMDTADMMAYIEQIRQFSLEQFSTYIPEPNEVVY